MDLFGISLRIPGYPGIAPNSRNIYRGWVFPSECIFDILENLGITDISAGDLGVGHLPFGMGAAFIVTNLYGDIQLKTKKSM